MMAGALCKKDPGTAAAPSAAVALCLEALLHDMWRKKGRTGKKKAVLLRAARLDARLMCCGRCTCDLRIPACVRNPTTQSRVGGKDLYRRDTVGSWSHGAVGAPFWVA